MLAPDGTPCVAAQQRWIDNAMVKAIARAFRWQRLLEDRGTAIAEIAAAEKINASYVSRVLRLTLLAPEIIEVVLDGRQPHYVGLNRLLSPIPADWERQKRELRLAV